MDLPQQFPYKPRLWVPTLNIVAGFAWIGMQVAEAGRMPHGFALWFGLSSIGAGLLGSLLRYVFPRRLLLGQNEFTLPAGFLYMSTATVAYDTLECVWRVYLPLTVVLRLATKQRRFQIVSVMLPDNPTYLAIEGFLAGKIRENLAARHSG